MENSNRGLKVGLGIAIALVLGLGIYAFNLYGDSIETQKQLTQEKELVLNDLSQMASQYDAAIGENEIANEKLIEAKNKIESLSTSLKTSESTIASLRSYRTKFKALQKEMSVLLKENDALRAENTVLASDLDYTKKELQARASYNDSLVSQNNELATIVTEASVMSITGLNATGVIARNSGKLIPTDKSKRADKVKVCFTVAKNPLLKPGNKTLYVQVIAPNRAAIGLNQRVVFDEHQYNFSVKSKFNYEQKNLDICEYINVTNKKEGFQKGTYIVNLFDEHRLLSTSRFQLK